MFIDVLLKYRCKYYKLFFTQTRPWTLLSRGRTRSGPSNPRVLRDQSGCERSIWVIVLKQRAILILPTELLKALPLSGPTRLRRSILVRRVRRVAGGHHPIVPPGRSGLREGQAWDFLAKTGEWCLGRGQASRPKQMRVEAEGSNQKQF